MNMWRVVAVLMAVVVQSCVQVEKPPGPGGAELGNASPRSVAGTGGTFLIGTTVALDGSASFDPDGELISYRWSIDRAPPPAAPFTDTGRPDAELLLDVAGTYVVRLTVEDDDGASHASTVTLSAEPPAVFVSAGEDVVGMLREPIELLGSAETEDGSALEYSWTIVQRPTGSTAALTNADTLQPTLVPDAVGTYVARLEAGSEVSSGSDDVSILIQADQLVLNYQLADVEYSRALERLVIVSDSPPLLHLLDPTSGEVETVALPKAPLAVSLEPGGLRAAVGHDGNLTVVDLETMTVSSTHVVTTVVGDLVFGADDRVHSIPRVDQWERIHTTDLSDGSEALGSGLIRAGTRARLNPARTGVAYGADRGLSPSDIERYDVSASPAALVRDSPYHGDYAMCGDLWFTDDGASIITACGNVFRSSDNPDIDMTYRGSLGPGFVLWADHASTSGHIIALRRIGSQEFRLQWFEDAFLAPVDSVAVPQALIAGAFRDTAPRFVAYRGDASAVYVIAEASGPFVLFRMSP